MPAATPTIIASSIGFDRGPRGPYDWRPGPVFAHAAERARSAARPRLCFVTTAVGDDPVLRAAVHSAFEGSDFDVSVLALFPMPGVDDVAGHLRSRDVIWVGGGSTANLLAVWGVHGLGEVLRDCWQQGVVLGGVSAGSLCWHTGGTTDSFGPTLEPITNCLGFVPWSNCPHYDSEEQRRPLYQRLVAEGVLGAGYATDDGAAVVYEGTEVAEVVADREGAHAYHVQPGPDGATETRLPASRLR
ncbi:MAG TPA: peptidase E [Acidimicrobiales bacterium]|nr:peptidase E [Acidimicrobiales bacterium]